MDSSSPSGVIRYRRQAMIEGENLKRSWLLHSWTQSMLIATTLIYILRFLERLCGQHGATTRARFRVPARALPLSQQGLRALSSSCGGPANWVVSTCRDIAVPFPLVTWYILILAYPDLMHLQSQHIWGLYLGQRVQDCEDTMLWAIIPSAFTKGPAIMTNGLDSHILVSFCVFDFDLALNIVCKCL